MTDTRFYAVGDLHGHIERLEPLLAAIAAHRAATDARLVFLGDYVDRGPDPRAVVERVSRLVAEDDAIALMGNHEDMMLGALAGEREANWLANGAEKTLASYGAADLEDLRAIIPASHRAFLARLRLRFETPDCLFVHAGIDPGRPLDDQERETMLWVREPFLDHPGPFAKLIIHGHTPTEGFPKILPHRVNVDTGCGRGDTLTCVVLEGRRVVDVLQA